MSTVLTLVSSESSDPLSATHIDRVLEVLRPDDIIQTCAPIWLCPEKAVDIGLSDDLTADQIKALHEELATHRIDLFVNPIDNRRKKLLLADMDSTIVEGETLDDLAAFAGLKDKVSEITAAAMEGKLDFHQAIRERVKLLQDLPIDRLKKALKNTKLNPGAEIFVKTMAAHGAHCVLVSGGFTFFTEAIAKRTGFHNNHGNHLGIDEKRGVLTGEVHDPILDKMAKVNFLKQYVHERSVKVQDTLTIGDGANDIPMLEMGGMGIGYQPKQAVKEKIDNVILYGDLTAALYAQGYSKDRFVKP